MNNTTKAKYELASKMLKAKIEDSEVMLMSGLTEAEIKRLKTELADEIENKEVYLNLADKDTDQFFVKADSKKEDNADQ